MSEPKHEDLVQTHQDIEEIPEGVEVSNSRGEEEPDEGEIEPEDYPSDLLSEIDLGEDIAPDTTQEA